MIRNCIFSELEMTGPLYFGSGVPNHFTDLPVLRDTRGIPFISGNALASAFGRDLDDDLREEWLGIPKDKNSNPPPSRILFDDATPLPEQQDALKTPVEIRDHVSIDRESASAKDDALFSNEVMPVGTVFLFSCRCDAENQGQADKMQKAIRKFLERGGSFGGGTRTGQGGWEAERFGVRYFDLKESQGLRDWLIEGQEIKWTGDCGKIKADWDKIGNDENAKPWSLKFEIVIDGDLHLSSGRSGLPVKGEPDQLQAKRKRIKRDGELNKDEYVDFGSGVMGRLRSLMELIVRTHLLALGVEPDALKVKVPFDCKKPGIDDLAKFFGYVEEDKNSAGHKGEWSVSETAWSGDPGKQQETHVRLDQFTQHAMDGALFTFEPINRGRTTVTVKIDRNPDEWKKVLIYQAVKLTSLNILPWAGKASRGYLGAKITCPKFKDAKIETPGALKEKIEKWAETATTK